MDTDSRGYGKQWVRFHLPRLANRLVPPIPAPCKDILSVFIGVHPWLKRLRPNCAAKGRIAVERSVGGCQPNPA